MFIETLCTYCSGTVPSVGEEETQDVPVDPTRRKEETVHGILLSEPTGTDLNQVSQSSSTDMETTCKGDNIQLFLNITG